MKQQILLAFKGLAMGIAETIPGVSGGTIAFITGIYEELLESIKAFHPKLFVTLKKDGIGAVWKAINGNFLVTLGAGMVAGIVLGVLVVSHFLENYPPILWAFFFGLILGSVIYISRKVGHWGIQEIVGFILATLLAFWLTTVSPASGNEALWFVFISGAIAISALILPGISGSFILLIMGMYSYIIPTVKNVIKSFDTDGLMVMFVFALGCITGLASFSRVLSWAFKKYKSFALAILTGFMLGSLNKIWPWRNVLSYRENSSGEQVPFLEEGVWPSAYDGESFLVLAIVAAVLGFVSVFLFEKLDTEN